MRQISQTSLRAMFSEDTNSVVLWLLEINHSSLDSPLLFCNNNEDIIHQGNTYQWFPFKVEPPADSDEQVNVQITISNVDQSIIQLLRSINTKPTIVLKVVVLDIDEQNPPETDTVEVGPMNLELQKYDATAQNITGTVGYQEDFLNQSFPSQRITPQTAPGAFK